MAKVNEHVLYKSDLETHLANYSYDIDSATIVRNYIDKWATERLLLDGAKRNLSKTVQDTFNKRAQDYRIDLYTKKYKDALIAQQLDTLVTNKEALEFYEANKNNFDLNEDLIKLRYVKIDLDFLSKADLQERFIRFNNEDKYVLDSLKFQFDRFFLNDSIWVKKSVVVNSIEPITTANADNLLKKSNFLQLRDSLGLYLITVKETLSRKQIAPLEYIRPTINEIILNKRKLALARKLEKEIKDDAIKNKKFEIYGQ